MPRRLVHVQTAFTAGELDPLLKGRRDTTIHHLGCARLENVIPLPQGPVMRRPGLRMVAPFVPGDDIRLAAFVFSVGQEYLISFTDQRADIWDAVSLTHEKTLATPWQTGDMPLLRWIQLRDTMIVVHPQHEPRQILRLPADWAIETFKLESPGDGIELACNTEAGSTHVVFPANSNFLEIGWPVSGPGIPEDATVAAKPNQGSFTLSQAATETAVGVGLTFAPRYSSGPFHPFHPEVTLTPRVFGQNIILNASEEVFPGTDDDWIGNFLRFRGRLAKIVSYSGPNRVTVLMTGEPLEDMAPSSDWQELAFSAARGWPRTVAFAQQRLIFGGSRDLPNRLWMSRIGAFRDFDLGDGEDDDGISLDLGTGQVHESTHLVPGRGGLEIFLRGEEGVVPTSEDRPITPRTVSYQPQTRYGASNARPTNIDGATIFLQRAQGTVRELIWSEAERGYVAASLSIRAPHLVRAPVALDAVSDGLGRQADFVFVVNGDGEVAVFTTLRAQQVTAWSTMRTKGQIRSVAVVGERIFMAVDRMALDDFFSIELLDPAARFDASVVREAAVPTTVWPDLTWLADQEVHVLADDLYLGTLRVNSAGVLELDSPASRIEVGHDFLLRIRPMPLEQTDLPLIGRFRQVVRVVARVKDAAGLVLAAVTEGGRELSRTRLPSLPFEGATDAPVPPFTGDVERRLIGWSKDHTVELIQEGPWPCTVLSLAFDVAIT